MSTWEENSTEFFLVASYIMQKDHGVNIRRFKKMVKTLSTVSTKAQNKMCNNAPGFISKTGTSMMIGGEEHNPIIEIDIASNKVISTKGNKSQTWTLNLLKWKHWQIWFGLNGSIAVTDTRDRDYLHIARKNFLHEFKMGNHAGYWNHSRNVAMYNSDVYYVSKGYKLIKCNLEDLCQRNDATRDEVLASNVSDFCITPFGEVFFLQSDGLLCKHKSSSCKMKLIKAEEGNFSGASMTSNEREFFASTFETSKFIVRIHLLTWRLHLLDKFEYKTQAEGEFPIVMRAFRLKKPYGLRVLIVCRHYRCIDLLAVFHKRLFELKLNIFVNENWLYGLEWNQYTNEIVIPQPSKTILVKLKF